MWRVTCDSYNNASLPIVMHNLGVRHCGAHRQRNLMQISSQFTRVSQYFSIWSCSKKYRLETGLSRDVANFRTGWDEFFRLDSFGNYGDRSYEQIRRWWNLTGLKLSMPMQQTKQTFVITNSSFDFVWTVLVLSTRAERPKISKEINP